MDDMVTDQAFLKLNELRLECKLCDVNLIVTRKQYHAHKIVLAARSSYFYTMFRDEKTEVVELLQSCFKPDGVMENLLEYMYTGRVQIVEDIELVEQLIAASDVLNLEGLLTILTHNLLNTMTLENYRKRMEWIEGYSLDNLLMIPCYESGEHCQSTSDLECLLASDTKYFLGTLNKLRLRGDFVDVHLMVDGKAFPAHKVILSAFNGYFSAMFTNETREKAASFVEMKLVPSSVMGGILELFYTGKMSSLRYEEAQDAIMVADYLDVNILKSKAEESLLKTMSCSNVFHLLELSIIHHCMTLRSGAVTFLVESFESVLESREFLGIPLEILDEVISSEDIDVEEETIFEFVMCWLQHNPKQRAKFLLSLLEQIKIEQLPVLYLERRVLQAKFVHDNKEGNQYVSSIIRRKKSDDFECVRPRGYTVAKIVLGLDEDQFSVNKMHACSCLCYIPESKTWYDISANVGCHVIPGPVVACHLGVFMMAFEPYKVDLYAMSLFQLHQHSLQWTKVIPVATMISGEPFADIDNLGMNHGTQSLCALGDSLYIVGSISKEPSNWAIVVCRYNPVKSDDWEICARLNNNRQYCALTSCLGSLYIIGGMGSDYQSLASVEQYSPESKHCTVVPSMLEARFRPVCTSSKSRIFVIGGMIDDGEMGVSSEMYDCMVREWYFFPGCETPRHTASVTLFKGKIYLFGGLGENDEIVNTTEIYDISSNSWSRGDSSPRAATHTYSCWTFLPRKTVKGLPVVIDEECNEDVEAF